ncbi:TRAP transporter large permease [Hoeflea poritis]|uniref:TRAP transporter large permease n=1 Tax=Hoeflea poritis TaxID=2993659 RepID=A0ABT4VKM4_9HYPH|nr:TRAP transporter large permease [Hoeflea poritis]MDA4845268.1 TRAP transporter large permease [Hoeflea poritis]
MFDVNTVVVIVVMLLGLVLLGVHVAVALGITSVVGIYLVTGKFQIVERMLASTAAEALRDFTFAVIPLFMLMGEFIARSGAITDIYAAINRGVRRLPGRLTVATVIGNTIFSFVTGVSIASAAAFSRIAYPEMRALGYHKGFALGSIAGSSCLGMLIPPSVLMIVWGILTEQSIGRLFLAGILPGLLLAALFLIYVVTAAILWPEATGEHRRKPAEQGGPDSETQAAEGDGLRVLGSFAGIGFIIAGVLGGIWFGIFTPTEGAGAGAAVALLFAIVKGMRGRDLLEAIFSVGKTAAPILILLLMAALYSRTLAMTGVTSAIQNFFLESGLSPYVILALMVAVWFLLGMVIDSISIMLLTVPIFEPLAAALGFDRISFAVIGILAIEAGLLTPPFGLLVYTVKAAIADPDVGVREIFKYSIPYWIIMLIGMISIIAVPGIANYLPNQLF